MYKLSRETRILQHLEPYFLPSEISGSCIYLRDSKYAPLIGVSALVLNLASCPLHCEHR